MISEIISFILGVIALIIAWSIPNKLEKDGFFRKENLQNPGYGMTSILLTAHGVILPGEYFKPQHIKEGWLMLTISFTLFLAGIYLLSQIF